MAHIDESILVAARGSVNFGLLEELEPLLSVYGAGAEATLYNDPNGALVKCRQFAEVLTEQLLRRTNTKAVSGKQVDRIGALEDAGVLTRQHAEAFHRIRKTGNDATHAHLFNARVALESLRACWELGTLLYRAVTGNRTVLAFLPPEPVGTSAPTTAEDQEQMALINGQLQESKNELQDVLTVLDAAKTAQQAEADARAEAENELTAARAKHEYMSAQLAGLKEQVAELLARGQLSSRPAERVTSAARQAFIERARLPRPLSEIQARRNIDRQLETAGWIIQDYKDIAPVVAPGVAVREFPLPTGFADYMLYVDAKLVGVIEAKKEGTALTGVEWQTNKYASGLPAKAQMASWRRGEPLPFCYESTGAETRFTNRLDPDARSREVFSFHRPQTMRSWMEKADSNPHSPTFNARIHGLPELNEDGLRPNQKDAVRGIERSLKAQHPRALVQMATGAGKTFTAVTSVYRLIKYAQASKVLFLVDRNNLGEQAESEFVNYMAPDDGRRFGDMYAVQRLAGHTVLNSTSVAISTIQRVFRMLQGEDLPEADTEFDEENGDAEPPIPVDVRYSAELPPETFDLIIVDECHRSIYGRWRAVLEYFDAPIVGLTATPTKQTMGFFDQNLVSEYTYEQSVADNVNVPFSVYRIKTQMTEQGATVEAGTVVPYRDRGTRRKRYEELEEDYRYTGQQIGRTVIAEDQIRTVLNTFRDKLYTEIFPGRSYLPKTLIFAKDDNHADEIVQQVREVFGKGQDFAAKITYKSRSQGHDPKTLLQEFRNSPTLRIAVTVDMIATGTDVRAIECVFFMREVRSAVYFEQMKGRGARIMDADQYAAVTPDAINGRKKDQFVIVDAVGVTDSPLVDAVPMERTAPSVSLEQLLQKAGTLTISADEVSTLAARLSKLETQLNPSETAELTQAAGGTTLRQIVKDLAAVSDHDAVEAARDAGGEARVSELLRGGVEQLAGNPELRKLILELRREKDILFDEVNADQLYSATRVDYGTSSLDRVKSFREFLHQHQEEIAVLQFIHGSGTGRPTYSQLQELAERVRRVPTIGSVDMLWQSYAALGELADPEHKPAVTDLFTILRHELAKEDSEAGVSGCILSYSAVIEQRLESWLQKQERQGVEFTEDQRWWIRRISDVVKTSIAVTIDDLDKTPFTERGGTYGFVRDFGADRALRVFHDLDEELIA
ncbi:DEAD/DEAH box helicase family protein [Arthrobacter sp. ISL-69]|uniref:DEAD/DEAH box helicase family protein n=1 Tax=Arthrobacter sp. ISL-69 TaxID=2819113 RepID=UPI001BEA14DF|nr:DEAD/DEAH box helicase family protein [Arthrobacter sp. ISL-69]MBT2536286.1 DEAD/DEAH box helicase family protein [Arthrobacter sp. ISL-69]